MLQAGVPSSLAFMPAEIADAARAQWEQALSLAHQAVRLSDSEARAQLDQLKREAEFRALTVELREKDWRGVISELETALQHSRDLVGELMAALEQERETSAAKESRIGRLESQVEGYRRQVGGLIAKAINKHQAETERRKPKRAPRRRARSAR